MLMALAGFREQVAGQFPIYPVELGQLFGALCFGCRAHVAAASYWITEILISRISGKCRVPCRSCNIPQAGQMRSEDPGTWKSFYNIDGTSARVASQSVSLRCCVLVVPDVARCALRLMSQYLRCAPADPGALAPPHEATSGWPRPSFAAAWRRRS